VRRSRSLAVLASLLLAAGCDLTEPCENAPIIDIPSPDKRLAAWVFVRDCGATTAKAVHVSVRPASAGLPRDPGNTLIIEQEATVVAEWVSPTQLLISYEPLGEIFKKESHVGEVAVSYLEQ
jgi:hypothetical protein